MKIIFIVYTISKILICIIKQDGTEVLFFRSTQLVSASEDGTVHIWDTRDKQLTNKIVPYLEERVARPHLGKWIGAAALSDNWLVSLICRQIDQSTKIFLLDKI